MCSHEEELTSTEAVLDLVQCFTTPGRLTTALIMTMTPRLGGLQLQLYRPLQRQDSVAACGEFRLVASADPLWLDKLASLGLYVEQSHGPYQWELLLHRYGMDFKAGDCLGWRSLGSTLMARALLTSAVTDSAGFSQLSCRTSLPSMVPQTIGDVYLFTEAKEDLLGAWGVMAFFEEPEDSRGSRHSELTNMSVEMPSA